MLSTNHGLLSSSVLFVTFDDNMISKLKKLFRDVLGHHAIKKRAVWCSIKLLKTTNDMTRISFYIFPSSYLSDELHIKNESVWRKIRLTDCKFFWWWYLKSCSIWFLTWILAWHARVENNYWCCKEWRHNQWPIRSLKLMKFEIERPASHVRSS